MDEITSRFLEAYKHLLSTKKVTDAKDFADKIGVSTSLMTEISKGRSNVGIKAIQNTVKLFGEIGSEWLITGKGKSPSTFKIDMPDNDASVEWAIKTYGIPLIPIDAFAGIGYNTDHQVIFNEIEDSYVIPLFEGKGVDFLISVRGSSMYPNYNSGDVVACKLIVELLFIQWNKIYVLNTKSQGVIIKRIKKSKIDDHILCRSDNKDYDDFDVPNNDILNIAMVVGSVRLE